MKKREETAGKVATAVAGPTVAILVAAAEPLLWL
jgi:hypothetical protein